MREKFELRLDQPLVVDQTPDALNVTVTLNPSTWLIDRNGNLIDPRQFSTDDRLVRRFRQRIRADLRALVRWEGQKRGNGVSS